MHGRRYVLAAACFVWSCSGGSGTGSPSDGSGAGGQSGTAGSGGGLGSSGAVGSSGASSTMGGGNSTVAGGSSLGGGTAQGGSTGTSTGGVAGATSSSGGSGGATPGMGGATTTGGGGAGTAGGSSTPMTGLPGVVVGIDSAGTLGCVPLCMGTTPSDATKNPDWGYENNASCVIKNTLTASTNQACVTGMPLPPPNRTGLSGVVVGIDSAGTLGCVPLCIGTMPSGTDPNWGWEFQASCIIRGTDTANCNQPCKTGEALPAATALPARSGVMIDNACTPLCACKATGMDPDWGWEYQAACVVPMSTTATGKLTCTTGQALTYVPPALTGTKKADGFYTSGGRLYDAYGNDFVMRGVNNPHIWFDAGNRYLAYRALDTIATYNTNTIRVVWETTEGSPALLAQVLYRVVQLKMVPVLELHDVTGSTSNADLAKMAQYYTQAEIKKVLTDFRAYLLINIANEWSGTDYLNAYRDAITTLRGAGILHTLVIDGNAFGQNAEPIFQNATALLNADPQKNLLFSVHMYGQYGTAQAVDAVLDRAVSSSVPLIVGEFGPVLMGQNVAWQRITEKCQANKLGYLAWSWKGNSDGVLDMAKDWAGPLTTWGQNVMFDDPNSVQRTAKRASIF